MFKVSEACNIVFLQTVIMMGRHWLVQTTTLVCGTYCCWLHCHCL